MEFLSFFLSALIQVRSNPSSALRLIPVPLLIGSSAVAVLTVRYLLQSASGFWGKVAAATFGCLPAVVSLLILLVSIDELRRRRGPRVGLGRLAPRLRERR